MRFGFIAVILVLTLSQGAIGDTGVKCPEGKYPVRSHPRRAYYRANGVFVRASQVLSSCREKREGHDFWVQKLKEGHPKDWIKNEKVAKWTEEQRERVLEALSELPEALRPISFEGFYRLAKSKDYPNPASHGSPFIVIYDTAFEKTSRLARVLAHELAHQLYEELNSDDGYDYRRIAGWTSRMDMDRTLYWIPRAKGFVKEDGQRKPSEDYANNIEHFLFEPETLMRTTPEVYNWIKSKYGDRLKIRGAQ